ncbi:succinyl-diaminopimelate desuccinylase [Candidatus Sneabacter namystus]|uniref:Succinyl-diaminopimelate desuccinylase n=1 Tax=Candidatus Sneabacter namystus TaxID=2601646 RepID=A0A5C0UKL1_9RICK|nr:succinyl-diaminopimelate desuccinylase [Candidatus Sneabacter namystus]QEK39394.1 succinyl-diaminopimelate desuccinylase [Candidatus Sneabacter namystus]
MSNLDPVIDLAVKLIRFPSVTPDSAGSVEFLEDLFQKEGFSCFRRDFDSDEYKRPVSNLYAYRGTEGPNICFAGHLDVVPPGNLSDWHFAPFDAVIEGDVLHGRGTVDMKGSIACSIDAALAFIRANPDRRVSFLMTTDEEGVAHDGVKRMLDELEKYNHKLDFAIFGEPTCKEKVGEVIAVGRRGSINFVLTCDGKQGHIAYPDSFVNPVEQVVEIAKNLKEIKLDDVKDKFSASVLNITSIDVGNKVTNLIPARAEIRFNIRFNKVLSESKIVALVSEAARKVTDNFSMSYECSALPFLSEEDDFIRAFAKVSKKITSISPKFVTGGATSDARFVSKCCPCIEFGLHYNRAHQVDEQVGLEDIKKLRDVYKGFLFETLSL